MMPSVAQAFALVVALVVLQVQKACTNPARVIWTFWSGCSGTVGIKPCDMSSLFKEFCNAYIYICIYIHMHVYINMSSCLCLSSYSCFNDNANDADEKSAWTSCTPSRPPRSS